MFFSVFFLITVATWCSAIVKINLATVELECPRCSAANLHWKVSLSESFESDSALLPWQQLPAQPRQRAPRLRLWVQWVKWSFSLSLFVCSSFFVFVLCSCKKNKRTNSNLQQLIIWSLGMLWQVSRFRRRIDFIQTKSNEYISCVCFCHFYNFVFCFFFLSCSFDTILYIYQKHSSRVFCQRPAVDLSSERSK